MIEEMAAKANKRYALNTDNQYYALCPFLGDVFDEAIPTDVVKLREYYFETKKFLCVCVWFKTADVDELLVGVDYIKDEFKKYYVFFDKTKMRRVEDKENDVVLWIPQDQVTPHVYITSDHKGFQYCYQVAGAYAKAIDDIPEYSWNLGQYYGFVESVKTGKVIEFIYGFAEDLK